MTQNADPTPDPTPMDTAAIRALALEAGFRVWKDGSITAADPVQGVPHSGAATQAVTNLVRLLEQRLAR